MNENMLYLCSGFYSKLTYPSINAIRTRGSLVQATAVVGLTNPQPEAINASKNITVCSSSVEEVSGIPSLLELAREGKTASNSDEEEVEVETWLAIPYDDDIDEFMINGSCNYEEVYR